MTIQRITARKSETVGLTILEGEGYDDSKPLLGRMKVSGPLYDLWRLEDGFAVTSVTSHRPLKILTKAQDVVTWLKHRHPDAHFSLPLPS